MASPTFTLANSATHREAILDISVEYVSWVAAGIEKSCGLPPVALLGMPIPAYVASVIDKVCGDAPPRGAFYLVEHDGAVAGMGGLRRIREGVAEIKRFYVRPAHRGKRLGEAILGRVIDDARAFGYRTIFLDTAPFMHSAQRLYEAAGFVDRAPYEEVEVPPVLHGVWRFMERAV